MDIYEVLRTRPHSERYLTRYVKFIQSRRPQEGPLEKHHICPKANDLFPHLHSFKDHPWNRIDLTPREHYVAHLLLWKAYGGSQTNAIHRMTSKAKRHSRIYDTVREQTRMQLKGNQNSLGKIRSEETRAKMRAAKLGKKFSEEHKAKMRLRTHSDETKAKISAARSNRPLTAEHKARISASRRTYSPNLSCRN